MVSVSQRNPGITRVDFAGLLRRPVGLQVRQRKFQIVVTSLLTWTPTRRSHNTIEYTSAVINDVTNVNTTSMVLFPLIIISVTFTFPFLLMHSIEGLSLH